jgi:hypothetical protein
MPRYHFHVYDAGEHLDPSGRELAGLKEARLEAVRSAGEMLRDDPGTFWNGDEWRMHVTDETGMTLFTLVFIAMDAPALLR